MNGSSGRVALLLCLGLLGASMLGAAAAAGPKPRKVPSAPPTAAVTEAEAPDPEPGSMPEPARLERLAIKRPGDKKVHLAAARHYLEQSFGADGRLDDASRHVNAVLAAEPSNFDALMLAGDIANRRGQPAVAAQHYRNATSANPNSKEALLALSGMLEQSGDHAGAQEALVRFRALNGMPPLQSASSAAAGPNSGGQTSSNTPSTVVQPH